MLVDPHDQESISDALMKLVADKQLWARCRENGLRNIHRFSWPEHCRTYLARITSCKQRQPKWQRNDNPYAYSETDSPGGSLRDIHDLSLSLKISFDGEKNEGIGNLVLKGQEIAKNKEDQAKNFPLKLSANEKPENGRLSMRKFMIVIAVDCDKMADILEIAKIIFEASRTDKDSQSIGFILSTSYSMSYINRLLETVGLKSSF